MIFTKFYRSDQQRALESVVIGAVARTNAVVTLIPITVLKTRYEVCISRMTVYCHYSDHYNLDNCFQMLINLYILMFNCRKKITEVKIGCAWKKSSTITWFKFCFLQSGLFDYKSIPRGLAHMYQTEGLRG